MLNSGICTTEKEAMLEKFVRFARGAIVLNEAKEYAIQSLNSRCETREPRGRLSASQPLFVLASKEISKMDKMELTRVGLS